MALTVRPDDEVYQFDTVWLGPDEYTLPIQARYVAWGTWLACFLVATVLLIPLGGNGPAGVLGSLIWALGLSVVLSRAVMLVVDHERPLRSLPALFSAEARAAMHSRRRGERSLLVRPGRVRAGDPAQGARDARAAAQPGRGEGGEGGEGGRHDDRERAPGPAGDRGRGGRGAGDRTGRAGAGGGVGGLRGGRLARPADAGLEHPRRRARRVRAGAGPGAGRGRRGARVRPCTRSGDHPRPGRRGRGGGPPAGACAGRGRHGGPAAGRAARRRRRSLPYRSAPGRVERGRSGAPGRRRGRPARRRGARGSCSPPGRTADGSTPRGAAPGAARARPARDRRQHHPDQTQRVRLVRGAARPAGPGAPTATGAAWSTPPASRTPGWPAAGCGSGSPAGRTRSRPGPAACTPAPRPRCPGREDNTWSDNLLAQQRYLRTSATAEKEVYLGVEIAPRSRITALLDAVMGKRRQPRAGPPGPGRRADRRGGRLPRHRRASRPTRAGWSGCCTARSGSACRPRAG